jgi:hypothetical protein
MVYFNHVLQEASLDLDPGTEGLSFEDISKYLEDPQLGDLDMDAPEE